MSFLDDEELIFRMVLVFLYTFFTIVRIYYRRKARNQTTIEEKTNLTQKLIFVMMVYEVSTFIAFVFFYPWIDWEVLHINYPVWIRWSGLPLGISAVIYFIIIHRTLGKNFSPKLQTKKEQTLVTTGPYKRIRHPMYLAFLLLHIAVFLIVANWIIGISWNIFIIAIIILRVKPEEEMMVKKFGKEYELYMIRTGRFIPKFMKS
jgi:protein-S-isoprenylcysteine O-methyltransferase Ste14